MDLITGMDAVTVPEHSSPSCIWLSLLCWCDSDGDQFLLILIHPPWRAEVMWASDAKYKFRITAVFPKIVSVKFRSARSQRMSIHKCSLAGSNETWTGCRARNTQLRFLAKIETTLGRVLLLRSAGLGFTLSIRSWNSSTVRLRTASSHLSPESWGSSRPWLFCYAALLSSASARHAEVH